MKKIIIFEDNFFFFDLIASIYGKILPIFTNYAKFFFCLFQLVSNTQELAGRHYTSPMWSVWHVAATLSFIWFVNFFKLIWFFFFLIWLLLYTVKSHQFSQTMPSFFFLSFSISVQHSGIGWQPLHFPHVKCLTRGCHIIFHLVCKFF